MVLFQVEWVYKQGSWRMGRGEGTKQHTPLLARGRGKRYQRA